jgi:hypothetical protein
MCQIPYPVYALQVQAPQRCPGKPSCWHDTTVYSFRQHLAAIVPEPSDSAITDVESSELSRRIAHLGTGPNERRCHGLTTVTQWGEVRAFSLRRCAETGQSVMTSRSGDTVDRQPYLSATLEF